jgi:hypothetical protein
MKVKLFKDEIERKAFMVIGTLMPYVLSEKDFEGEFSSHQLQKDKV